MDLLQTILVILTASAAVLYLIQKFVWKPAFLKSKSSKAGCGTQDCGCH